MSVGSKPHVFTGLIRLRDHCTFTWEQPEGDPQRTAIVRENHCEGAWPRYGIWDICFAQTPRPSPTRSATTRSRGAFVIIG